MPAKTDADQILIVDDEESLRSFMEIMLKKEGYRVTLSASGAEALAELDRSAYDLVVTDLMMPEMTGLELLGKAKQRERAPEFIVMTAFGSVDSAIEAMKLGAADYIIKPFNVDQIKLVISRTLDKGNLVRKYSAPKKELGHEIAFENIIGASEPMQRVIKMARQVSQSDATVLLRGESGVGKDLMAHAIHNCSGRSSHPFVTINCAALPENLLESELFGHKKGSFTGAVRDKEGLFQSADKGTLFLDEIGNVSMGMQVKLLRVLEDQLITPVGETKPVKVDVRLIAATNSDLEADIDSGSFRHDLYYRLNVIQVDIPSLRERPEDIPVLAEFFMKKHCRRADKEDKSLSSAANALLKEYSWPGNVRELENSIERAVLLSKGAVIEADDFHERLRSVEAPSVVKQEEPASPTLQSIEKAYIYYMMDQNKGNKAKVAKILGIDSSTLYRKLERYGWKKREN